MIKAENVTIVVPNKGCDKNCPYCISKLTPCFKKEEHDLANMNRNLDPVLRMAAKGGATTVMLTGKGEPMMNFDDVKWIASRIKGWPLELQTNGNILAENSADTCEYLPILYLHGFHVIAISIDSADQLVSYTNSGLFKKIRDNKMISRITVNANEALGRFLDFKDLSSFCSNEGIRQLTVRRLSYPSMMLPGNVKVTRNVTKWIDRQNTSKDVTNLFDGIADFIKDKKFSDIEPIRITNDGNSVYDVNGMGFVHSEYCIQESGTDDSIRSLIVQEDGHVYTSWGTKASVLF